MKHWGAGLVIMGLFFCGAGLADSFWAQHIEGWDWYKDAKPLPRKPEVVTTQQFTSSNPVEQLQALQQQVETAKATAVLYPTQENVLHYIQLQNAITENASHFSEVWTKLIWQHPELNYQLQHPTNQTAQQAMVNQKLANLDGTLAKAAQEYGLFFFFEGKCPFCQRFAPTLQRVAQQYHFSVLPITVDGLTLPEFPKPTLNQGQAEAFHVTRWPALFLVNPQKRLVIPVTFGLISDEELKERMVSLIEEAKRRGQA